ncbi:unnamed protein product [Diamesa hyperborea]
MSLLVFFEFEIFGNVQEVYFRKYTQKQSIILGLRGWCMNSTKNTVIGRIEGDENRAKQMREWLRTTGSTKSTIEKAIFTEPKRLKAFTCKNFSIKR